MLFLSGQLSAIWLHSTSAYVLRSDIFSLNRLRSVLLLYCMKEYIMTREPLHYTILVTEVVSTGRKMPIQVTFTQMYCQAL